MWQHVQKCSEMVLDLPLIVSSPPAEQPCAYERILKHPLSNLNLSLTHTHAKTQKSHIHTLTCTRKTDPQKKASARVLSLTKTG